MAPKKIYTRKNLGPNPILESVEDLEKLLRKKKAQNDTGISLNRSTSLPKEGVISIEDLEFDEKYELSLFRSKSDSDLTTIVLDLERFNTFIPSTSSQISKEEKEEFWNSLTTRLKEQLEQIQGPRNSNPLDFIIKKKLETQVQDIKTPSKPIPSKSPQISLKKHLPIYPIDFPPFAIISYLIQNMAAIFSPLALPD